MITTIYVFLFLVNENVYSSYYVLSLHIKKHYKKFLSTLNYNVNGYIIVFCRVISQNILKVLHTLLILNY